MKRFVLIGEKLGHSISPQIHQEIFRQMGWQAEYGLMEVPKHQMGAIFQRLEQEKISGANVTIPYKLEIMKNLRHINALAKAVGAVNTLTKQDGQWQGFNTDVDGLYQSFLRLGFSGAACKAVVLGDGGASQAVQFVLGKLGAKEIHVITRHPEKGLTLGDIPTLGRQDILINTTPVGMFPNVEISPVDAKFFQQFDFAFDLIYNPLKTKFLREAEEAGLGCLSGLAMLVYQAIRADELWFEQKIPPGVAESVLSHMEKLLGGEDR